MTIGNGLIHRFLLDHPAEAGRVLERHQPALAADILSRLHDEAIAAALKTLIPGFAASILSQWPAEKTSRSLAHLDAASCARLLRRLDRETSTEIVEQLPEQQSRRVKGLLQYESNSAGALMDPNPPVVSDKDIVARSLERIREENPSSMPYLYVVDDELKLSGVLTTSELIHANPDQPVRSRMKPVTEFLLPKAGLREILDHPGWRTLRALPVVDRHRRLLGVIRFGTYVELAARLRGSDAIAETSTVEALGDLFFTGFSGLLEAATRPGSTSRAENQTAAADHGVSNRRKG